MIYFVSFMICFAPLKHTHTVFFCYLLIILLYILVILLFLFLVEILKFVKIIFKSIFKIVNNKIQYKNTKM